VQISRSSLLLIACCLLASAIVQPGFSVIPPESKPSRITFPISIPKSELKAQLEKALPVESAFDEEYEKYGFHFRNLKITREHLDLAWKNNGLEITTHASARFEIKVSISGWQEMTAEMITGIRTKPSMDTDWTLHLNAEPILKITRIGKISIPKADDLVAAWLKSEHLEPIVTNVEDTVAQSDFLKTAVEDAAKQMADGIKVDKKSPVWVQINVLLFAQPRFSDTPDNLVCRFSAKAVVAATKHKPKVKRLTGLTPLSLSSLDDGLPINGQITVVLNDLATQSRRQIVGLDMDLTLPFELKGRGNITLNKINFDEIEDVFLQ